MKELPKGLVLSTGQAPAVIGDVSAVDLGDIVQLWKGEQPAVIMLETLA